MGTPQMAGNRSAPRNQAPSGANRQRSQSNARMQHPGAAATGRPLAEQHQQARRTNAVHQVRPSEQRPVGGAGSRARQQMPQGRAPALQAQNARLGADAGNPPQQVPQIPQVKLPAGKPPVAGNPSPLAGNQPPSGGNSTKSSFPDWIWIPIAAVVSFVCYWISPWNHFKEPKPKQSSWNPSAPFKRLAEKMGLLR